MLCLFLYCFTNNFRSSRNELNQILQHVRKIARFYIACAKFGYPFPSINWGSKIRTCIFEIFTFSTTSRLKGNFNGECCRKKHYTDNPGSCVENYKALDINLYGVTLAHKRRKIDRSFYPRHLLILHSVLLTSTRYT